MKTASDSGTLRFVKDDGFVTQCEGLLEAEHNTDNAEQPLLIYGTGLNGPTADCQGFFRITATYKDESGTTRKVRSVAGGTSFGSIEGAYSATSVSLTIDFTECDAEQSDSCSLTLTASPK